MKQFYVFLLLFCITHLGWSQVISQRAYGGFRDDQISSATPISGGYLLVGKTYSFDGSQDILVIKTDAQGDTVWVRSINNTNSGNNEEGFIGCEANDGGYIVSGIYDNNNVYVAKLSVDGAMLWQKYYGVGSNSIVTGLIANNNGYAMTINSDNEISVMLLNNDGTVKSRIRDWRNRWNDAFTDIIALNGVLYVAGFSTNDDRVSLWSLNQNTLAINFKYEYRIFNPDNSDHHNFVSTKITANGSNIAMVTRGNDWRDAYVLEFSQNGTLQSTFMLASPNNANPQFTDITKIASGYSLIGYINTNGFGSNDVLYANIAASGSPTEARIYGGRDDDQGVAVFSNANGTNTLFANARSFGNNFDVFVINNDINSRALCNEQNLEFTVTVPAQLPTQSNISFTPSAQGVTVQNVTNKQISMGLFRYLCVCSGIDEMLTTAPACNGTSVTFWYPGFTKEAIDHTWYFGQDASITSSKNDSVTVVYKNPGIKYITLDVKNNGCLMSNAKAIVIYATPQITSIVSKYESAAHCQGSKVQFTPTIAPTTEQWQFNWDFGQDAEQRYSTAQSPEGVAYTKSGIKTVSLNVHNAHCSHDTNFAVTMNQTPKASFTTNAARCSGLPVSFKNTGTTGATYNWTFGDVAVAASTVENPEAIYNAAGLKTVQLVSSIGACTDTAKETITVYATPLIGAITIVPSLATAGNNYCEGSRFDASTVVIPNTEHVSYAWDFGADAVVKTSTDAAPKAFVYSKAGTKTISLVVQSEHCTSVTKTASVTVNPKPKAEFASTSPQCTGEKVNFISTGTPDATYSWTFTTDATIINGADSREVNVSFSTSGEKSIQLVASFGTCFDTVRHGITIHETPTVHFAFDTLLAFKKHCANDLVQLTNEGSTGADWFYSWNLGEGAEPALATTANPRVAYSFGGKKHITFKIASDYCSATLDSTIYIDTLPKTLIAAQGFATGMNDIRICANTSIELKAATSKTTNKTYTWYLPNNAFEAQKTVKASSVIVAPKAAETIYTLTTYDTKTQCTFIDSITVIMLPSAIANAGVDVAICRGESIQIGAALIEGQTYSWIPTNSLNNVSIPNPVAKPDSTTKYTVSVRYRDCPEVLDQVTVTVHQLPKVQATDYRHKDSTEIARGESVQLMVIGALQYIWSPFEGLNNEGIYNPVASPDKTTLYHVKGTDIYGCSNTDSIKVTVLTPKIWIPTAFTPTGDNLNDGFCVRGEGIAKFELSVFSRSGESLFYSQNQKQAWDGRKEGTNTDMPQGAYIYYTKGTLSDGSLFEQRGIINLLR